MPDLERLVDGPINVTFALIAACVCVSLVGFWALDKKRYRERFLFVPSRPNAVGALLSHFAHGDVGHLLLNMLALFFFGPRVEREFGPLEYGLIYAASGAAGTLAVWLFRRKNPRYASLGASGAIAGVVFASVLVAPTSTIFLYVVPMPAPVFAVLYLVFSSVKMGGRDGVAHEAHLGGAIAGFALAGALYGPGFAPFVRAATRLFS